MKVLTIFGTRPEAIKMAPVILEMRKHPKTFQNTVCVSAQHRQMLDQVLDLFEIKPDIDLNLMKQNQGLPDLTSRVLMGITSILQELKPDRILVQGDTTTTFASALAAFYANVPVGHIEAGLRTFNLKSPWPEEMNRCLTTKMSDKHFAPTKQNKENLIREGVEEKNIFVTGNTVIDALFEVTNKIEKSPALQEKFQKQFPFLDSKKKMILVTGHRRENFGDGMKNICEALSALAKREDVQIVYPVHLNPNVQQPVKESLQNHSSIHLIEPLDYLPFVYLMMKSYLILTDSGGLQEEAPSLGKPVLVMRDTTERQEGVEAGTVKLVTTKPELIVREARELLDNGSAYSAMSKAHNPYGDGHASERIIEELMR